MNKCILASIIIFTALTCNAPARAETVNCTAITTVPYTISTPGAYYSGGTAAGTTNY